MSWGDGVRTGVSIGVGNIISFATIYSAGGGGQPFSLDFTTMDTLDPRVTFSRASTGTYYDASGVLQTASSNVARFQHDPLTGANLGLIRENQGTNFVTYSEQFDNAAWVKLSVTVTANTIVAPDGTLTADSIIQTTSNGEHNIRQDITINTNVDHTLSWFVQANGSTKGRIISYFGANRLDGLFDLTAKTLTLTAFGTATAVNSQITELPNNWFKLSITGRLNQSTITTYNRVDIYNDLGNNVFIGDGISGFYLWGAQLEANLYPTSYIKTVASQVTRAADIAFITNDSYYDGDAFTAVTSPYGVSSVSSQTATLNGDVPIETLAVYSPDLTQDEINTLVENDGWWNWRIIGYAFALPSFTTDGSIQVDWGDGTVETLTTAVHTFTNASPHTIRFRQMTGTWFKPYINNNATYKNMVVALGSAPSNMLIDTYSIVYGCANLKSIDATFVGKAGVRDLWLSFANCTGLTSFPYIDTSLLTTVNSPWSGCSNLQSFPALDFSSATGLGGAWLGCSSLTSFPLIQNTSSVIAFNSTWQNCTSLTSFPTIDTSSGTNFTQSFYNCNKLTSFPLIDTSAGTGFSQTWYGNSSLTSFPLVNVSLGTNFYYCWTNCTNLQNFPANMFDSWTGVPVANCFLGAWNACTALTTTSVENILVSIDTSGTSAPAAGTEITISYNVATGALTAPTTSAITSLKGKNWTIKINGVFQ